VFRPWLLLALFVLERCSFPGADKRIAVDHCIHGRDHAHCCIAAGKLHFACLRNAPSKRLQLPGAILVTSASQRIACSAGPFERELPAELAFIIAERRLTLERLAAAQGF